MAFPFLRGKQLDRPPPAPSRPRVRDRMPTVKEAKALYHTPPSFTDHLPWLEVEPDHGIVLLSDGRSLGLAFDIIPVSTEAKPEAWLHNFRNHIQDVLASAIPEEADPWIVQIYVQDETHFGSLADAIEAYAQPSVRNSKFSQQWFGLMRAHLDEISQPGGLFYDELITGNRWQGRRRTVRGTLYRPVYGSLLGHDTADKSSLQAQELLDVYDRLSAGLFAAGVKVKKLDGKGLHRWLCRWFNPAPETTAGDTEALLALSSYIDEPSYDRPYGWDFSETLLTTPPTPDPDQGIWWIDGLPHRAIVLQGLNGVPAVGTFTNERRFNDKIFALFDKLPDHSILAMTITVKPQDQVRGHLQALEKAAFGDYAEARLASREAKVAQDAVASGNRLFPVQVAVYVRGEDAADLKNITNRVNAQLLANRLRPIREQDDLCPLDAYIRNLPMAYSPHFDAKEMHRSRMMFSAHISNLVPLYGRSTGTGNPGLLFFNRGGEPLMVDPLNLNDRKKNAHALLLGPTGSGKSATLIYMILQMLALYRPRVFLVESGNSFGLLGQYLEKLGLTVNAKRITPNSDISLPPFADALKLLDLDNLDFDLNSAKDLDDDPTNDYDEDTDDDEDAGRDILGEMEISARIMITGGEEKEELRMTRSDRRMIRAALFDAAQAVKAAGRDQVLTEDVEAALRRIERKNPRSAERAEEMADAISLFCSPGSFEAKLFNRPGKAWPDVDVTIVDLGLLARENYEDKLTVAYIGLMNTINSRVERLQNDKRPTLVITDEGHIITVNPLLAPYVIKITKMWRKLGAWFWIATQNLEDFPEASRRMLSMLEWWFCLVMPKDEIEQVARFRQLTDEQTALLLAARKSPGLYTEGVLLTDHIAALFRNVPTAIALALGMTEKEEKAERYDLMKKHGCSELEAALMVADSIAKKRRG